MIQGLLLAATKVDQGVFAACAVIVLSGAIGVVISRNPVHAALSLVMTLFGIAVLFVALEAHFLAAVQVIVYSGAIVVLFLFVIMLLDIRREQTPWAPGDRGRILLAILLSGTLLVELVLVVGRRLTLAPAGAPPLAGGFGTTQTVGRLLFTDYLFPFEITSIILLVAMVGAMVLAKKHLP